MDIQFDVTNVTLETPRLLLRAFREEDATDFFAYASVPGVGEMAGWKHHESMEDTRRVLGMFLEEKNVFALVHKEDGRVIGSLGLHVADTQGTPYEDKRCKEIGYVLSKAYWGRGLMPEAVNEVIRYCFAELGAELLTVGHFEGNEQSRRVIEKCGFTFLRQYHSAKHGKDVFDYVLEKE
ncbi:MAG: GNAT family N-acetyltransferase [Clostridia bacterium]|nr:GNAT family N-acetyltransferase [Clostridia bacterium]